MAKILDLNERLQAKVSKAKSTAAAFNRSSQRQRILIAAVMSAHEAGSSHKEIARTLRFIADDHLPQMSRMRLSAIDKGAFHMPGATPAGEILPG